MRKPFYVKRTKAWYVWHSGRQIRLDSDKETAFRKYHELKASEAPVSATDTVATLANTYLEWCRNNRGEGTYQNSRRTLSLFIKHVGSSLVVSQLKPMHVTNWLADQPGWGPTTQNRSIRIVKRVFNWAINEGRLDRNPLAGLACPKARRREHAITSEQHAQVLAEVKDQAFRDYLVFLYETGARPQEARIIEAQHCQLDAERIVLPPSEAKGKQDYRVIYLTPAAAEIVTRLCKKHSDGPILRTNRGSAWSKDSVNCRFTRLKEKLSKEKKTIKGLCATSWRHGFATEALKRGVDPVTVSILMGHKDTTMVARIYQHLAQDASYLSKSLNRVRGPNG